MLQKRSVCRKEEKVRLVYKANYKEIRSLNKVNIYLYLIFPNQQKYCRKRVLQSHKNKIHLATSTA